MKENEKKLSRMKRLHTNIYDDLDKEIYYIDIVQLSTRNKYENYYRIYYFEIEQKEGAYILNYKSKEMPIDFTKKKADIQANFYYSTQTLFQSFQADTKENVIQLALNNLNYSHIKLDEIEKRKDISILFSVNERIEKMFQDIHKSFSVQFPAFLEFEESETDILNDLLKRVERSFNNYEVRQEKDILTNKIKVSFLKY